ncbi:MAG TPA: hypothetical protein VHC98_01930 [Candidatus Saccharimonadales bacterium]|nr:hypothetical protein [Candidatus Saccharimonadales bacterium]
MSADEFTKLFKYMEERFDRIDERFEDTNGRIDQILNAVDALAKRQGIDEEERLVMGHQIERLDQWVH